jgi:hypothetical protein
MEARLRYVIPLTLALVVALLYLALRGWPQTFLVLSTLPFAVAGSVWLLAFMDYNVSTAVWVGSSRWGRRRADRDRDGGLSGRGVPRYMREGRIQDPRTWMPPSSRARRSACVRWS